MQLSETSLLKANSKDNENLLLFSIYFR